MDERVGVSGAIVGPEWKLREPPPAPHASCIDLARSFDIYYKYNYISYKMTSPSLITEKQACSETSG